MTTALSIAAIGLVTCWLLVRAIKHSLEPGPGEAPEDDGAAYDGNTCHTCHVCGARVSGPKGGDKLADCVCWNCAGMVSFHE